MKKTLTVIFVLSFIESVFAQSVLISPNTNVITAYGSQFPLIAGQKAGGTSASPTPPSINNNLLFLGGRGYANGGFSNGSSGTIRIIANEDFTPTANGTYLSFSTTPNTTLDVSERMRIAHDGNVGIGTINPTRKLHISQGTSGVTPSSNAKVFIEGNANTYLNFGTPDNSESGILFGKASFGGASGGIIYTSARDMQIRTSTNDTRMVVTEAGNVGIGIAIPTAKLDVVGDVVVSGVVTGDISVDGEIKLSRASSTTANTSIGYDPFDRNGHSYAVLNTGVGVTAFIRGFTAATTGTMLYLVVAGNGSVIIQDDNGSVVANKIFTNISGDVTINGQGSAIFIYESGWRLLSFLP